MRDPVDCGGYVENPPLQPPASSTSPPVSAPHRTPVPRPRRASRCRLVGRSPEQGRSEEHDAAVHLRAGCRRVTARGRPRQLGRPAGDLRLLLAALQRLRRCVRTHGGEHVDIHVSVDRCGGDSPRGRHRDQQERVDLRDLRSDRRRSDVGLHASAVAVDVHDLAVAVDLRHRAGGPDADRVEGHLDAGTDRLRLPVVSLRLERFELRTGLRSDRHDVCSRSR